MPSATGFLSWPFQLAEFSLLKPKLGESRRVIVIIRPNLFSFGRPITNTSNCRIATRNSSTCFVFVSVQGHETLGFHRSVVASYNSLVNIIIVEITISLTRIHRWRNQRVVEVTGSELPCILLAVLQKIVNVRV